MSNLQKKFNLPKRYQSQNTNIWVEYFELATKYKPVDLGGGYPNFAPPDFIQDAFKQTANTPHKEIYQYTRGAGHPGLVARLSKLYSKLLNREINPFTEIIATLGGYHALFLSIMAIIDHGDEVIVIEPFFDCYKSNVESAGGIPRFIPLTSKENSQGATSADWVLDFDYLETLFNEKTKAIIVNTPHNPLGKVFDLVELTKIADLCKKYNVICISDEVYEFLVYDNKKHIRMASLPEMWNRTITIGSAGKAFGATGFKLGWVYGPDFLISNLQKVHFTCVRAGNTFLQETAAICIEHELKRFDSNDCYFKSLAKELEPKRNFVFNFLRDSGFKPILCEGGYFIVADWSQLEPTVNLSEETDAYKDYRFIKWMIKKLGVQAIPVSAFYSKQHKTLGEKFVRFCFVKTEETLENASHTFKNWTQL